MNKNKKVLIVVGVVAVASVFSGAAAWLYLKGDKAVKPEQVSVSKPQETAGSTGTSNNTEADAKQGEPSQPRAPTPSTTEPATGTVTPTQAPTSAPIPLPTGTVPTPTPAPSPAPTPMHLPEWNIHGEPQLLSARQQHECNHYYRDHQE